MHLRYDMTTASIDCREDRHPQLVMRELGITYQRSTPQSMAEQIWFWNCKGVPTVLPKYLTVLNLEPHECIGFGLTKEDADKIATEVIDAASARLIAAAPDLLEALKSLVECINETRGANADKALAKARATIAKATGAA